ncbi:MAG TPA: WYL domain-containing protein [Candidatus Obscuribacterales bacterium]
MSQQSRRLGAIIKLIANNPGITLNGLLKKLDQSGIKITERTLAKDILSLKHDFDLLPKRERLRHGYLLEDVCSLSETELHLVLDAMHVFGSRLSDPEAQAMMERLLQVVKVNCRDGIGERTQSRTIGVRNIYRKSKDSEQIEQTLMTGIREHLPVSFTYHTPRVGKPEQLEGYPLFLIFHERGWYCIVRNLRKEEFSPRRIDRIKKCAILRDGDFNEEHAENVKEAQFLISCGWGMTFPRSRKELKDAEEKPEIVVRFDRTIAPYILESVERHPRGRIKSLPDGTGDVEFRIRLSNPMEFQFWVRSFGSKAWFVSPESLVESERTELRRLAKRYSL